MGAALYISACSKAQAPSVQSCVALPNETKDISSAAFILGAGNTYPEERQRRGNVGHYNIDTHEVTNAQFAGFIAATDYITTAERPQAGFDVPGAAVFTPPTANHTSWWRFIEGASWQHPEGPDSSIEGQDNHPVVQVSYMDALAYADWAGRALPTEAQWEYAAKAGSETLYVWGEERVPNGTEMANTWQGAFPIENFEDDGYRLRAPVGCYPANDFGLYDMIGNVWEWTASDTGPNVHVIKGGSFLCAENFCSRYRSAARQFQETDLPTNHIGFRTVSK